MDYITDMGNINNKKIAIIGGHMTPALATKDVLVENGYTNILWIGSKFAQTNNKNFSLEYQIIKESNIKFVELKTGKLWRKFTRKTLVPGIKNLVLIPYGFVRAFYILVRYHPDIIVSFGGHIALPVVIIARILGKKSVTHEQTIVTGLTNRIIARFANIVCVSWKQSISYFPPGKAKLTGLPIRKELFAHTTRQKIFNNNLPVLLVQGGNQGSNTINWRLSKILPELLKQVNIIHLTGNSTLTKDYENALQERAKLDSQTKERYIVKENAYTEEYAKFINNCDIVLSRAGANTIAEILALGKLCVLIPIPWSSHNEQLLNAQIVEKSGLGLILRQHDDLQPQELLEMIMKAIQALHSRLDFHGNNLEKSKQSARMKINTNAAYLLFREIQKLLAS